MIERITTAGRNDHAFRTLGAFRAETDQAVPSRERKRNTSRRPSQSHEWKRLRDQFVELIEKLPDFIRRSYD